MNRSSGGGDGGGVKLDEGGIEARLTRKLETAPMVAIPEDFALRVAQQVPARVVAARREIPVSNFGGRMAVLVAGLLLVALLVLLRFGSGGESMRWMEIGLGIEFAALTSWLGLRQLFGSR